MHANTQQQEDRGADRLHRGGQEEVRAGCGEKQNEFPQATSYNNNT